MSKVFMKEIESNFIEFSWGDEILTFREVSQSEIEKINMDKEDIHEESKKQLDLRISGKAKEAFLAAWYQKKGAFTLLSQLNTALAEETKGK